MLKREDFVFCVGYQGDSALVDSRAKKKYRNCTAKQLLDEGLFRAAFSSAVYDKDESAMTMVIDAYNAASGANLQGPEDMKRLLGIFSVPEDISKVLSV